eukprot:gene12098-5591_t
MKIQELVQEKYINFINFIMNKFPENKEIEKMKNIEIKLILHYLKNSIYPLKHDISLLMLNISDEYNIKLSEFTNDEIEKMIKYINFFNEMIEEIYFKN